VASSLIERDRVNTSRISRSQRFTVLFRDKFTCQYCGRKAPDVILQIDHKVPHLLGGADRLENLVTACEDCNQGKGTLEIIADPPPAYVTPVSLTPEQLERLEAVPSSTVSTEEVMRLRTVSGSWTRKTLESWDVPWPPPRGWKAKLTGEMDPPSEAVP